MGIVWGMVLSETQNQIYLPPRDILAYPSHAIANPPAYPFHSREV